ncbi:response regulator transcription factor [Burkholderia ubonensis]|uniref:response regulator transcription factor n=1 Tax=Burkholderia ubonensis TaxID=101571 RepID=UPI0012F7B8C0|nr:response regulator transcription factor [Burkholderia ubonensis]
MKFDDQLGMARATGRVEFSVVFVDARGGIESCKLLLPYLMSRLGAKVPVIVLNVQRDQASIVDAFEAGADDVVLAPASAGELHARAVNALRGARAASERLEKFDSIELGHYRIDRKSRSVVVGNRRVDLTEKELEIVWFLFLHKNEDVTRKQIAMTVWGTSEDIAGRSLEQYIYRLRSKLDLNGAFGVRLQTLYGRGYRIFEVDGDARYGGNDCALSSTAA